VLIEKQQRAAVQPQPFPHTIANDEATIEDGHLCIRARHHPPVQVNQRLRVARISDEVLTTRHESPAHTHSGGR
jgi:hypothetical protein